MTHYFKMTYRSFLRNKQYSLLSILSLAVGLSASLLIMLWVLDELSYDQFHKDKEKLYQVWDTQRYSSDVFTFQATPGPLAEGLKTQFPEVSNATRTSYASGLIATDDKSFVEDGVYVDSSFFSMFTFPFANENLNNPLSDNSSIVISEKLAEKLFPNQDAVNKSVRFQDKEDFIIKGVFKDTPQHSSFQFEYAIPFAVLERDNSWLANWGSNGINTYISLHKAEDESKVNEKILHFIKQYNKESIVELFIWPFTKTKLYSNFVDGKPAGGAVKNVRNMAIVALVILIMAVINFVNLSTARSAVRSKEVGVKKVVGATRRQLILQFLVESLCFTLLAAILAIGISYILIPFYNQITQKQVYIDFSNPLILGCVGLVVLVTALLSGIYPAILLSSLKPSSMLKGSSGGSREAFLRKALVVVQFGMTIILISTVLTVFRQIDFIMKKDVGFNREDVIIYRPTQSVKAKIESFTNDVKTMAGVVGISAARSVPFNIGSNGAIDWEGKPQDKQVLVQQYGVDYDLIPTMQMKITKGRNFSKEVASDSSAVIVSEQLAKIMEFDDPIGKKVNGKYTIIGVVRDFNSWSLYEQVNPLMMYLNYDNNRIFVKVESGAGSEVMKRLETLHKKYDDIFPFDSNMMDEGFKSSYSFESTIGKLSSAFTILGVIVSCLGLVGLVSYTAERRAKEIGVRKVLGATVTSVIALLFKDFGKLILLASLLSIPISYFVVNDYLGKFAYHFESSLLFFVIPCVGILVIAFISVFYHSFKAAMTNPTKVLRSE